MTAGRTGARTAEQAGPIKPDSRRPSSITWSPTIAFLITCMDHRRTILPWPLPARRQEALIAPVGIPWVEEKAATLLLIRTIRKSFMPVLTAERLRAMTIAQNRQRT